LGLAEERRGPAFLSNELRKFSGAARVVRIREMPAPTHCADRLAAAR
jgi:hypothetical protein